MNRWAFALVLVYPAVAGAHAEDEGQPSDRHVAAVRTKGSPTIDGKLDDAVWDDAPADDRFFQIMPEEGKPPTERTLVKVLYDDENIYIAVRCEDKEANLLEPRLTRRDRDRLGRALDRLAPRPHHRVGVSIEPRGSAGRWSILQ
jgi:hypothetical protein